MYRSVRCGPLAERGDPRARLLSFEAMGSAQGRTLSLTLRGRPEATVSLNGNSGGDQRLT